MKIGKLAFSSGVANTFEWYDYALFGHFAAILGEKFFPGSNPRTELLQAFLVFAMGYLMRPIGGIFFGALGDKFGRRFALSVSVYCMSFPTVLIGLLPTYETIGPAASILMIILRMVQGLSMGGALTGSVSFVIEHTEKNRRGFVGSIPMASICIGILFGSLASFLIKHLLSVEQFNDWGWRVPFLFGIVVLFAGIYIRKYTNETPLFEGVNKAGLLEKSPIRTVIKNHWFDMIISIGINSTGSVIFYLQAIFLVSFLKFNRDFNSDNVDILVNCCYVLMAVITLVSGWISDKLGRKNLYFVCNIIIILAFLCDLLDFFIMGDFTIVCIGFVTLAILAAFYIGPEPALQAEFYPTRIRNTALSLSYNLATSIFGGTTPYVMGLLISNSASISYAKYYVIACAIFSMISLCFYKDRSGS